MVRKPIRKKFSGLAILETALVLPLLLLVSLGAIKYGHLFLKAQQITNAARNGARTAIRPDANNANVEDAVEALMDAGGMPLEQCGYILTLTPDDVHRLAGVNVGQSIEVRIVVDANAVGVLNVPLFPNPGRLGASVTMAKEGF